MAATVHVSCIQAILIQKGMPASEKSYCAATYLVVPESIDGQIGLCPEALSIQLSQPRLHCWGSPAQAGVPAVHQPLHQLQDHFHYVAYPTKGLSTI